MAFQAAFNELWLNKPVTPEKFNCGTHALIYSYHFKKRFEEPNASMFR